MEKALRILFILCVVAVGSVILTGGGFAAGYLVRQSDTGFALPATSTQQAASPTQEQTMFAPFWEAWDLVHKQYVDQPVDDLKLMQGAIRGMVAALEDPHSNYMTPEEYQIATTDLTGELEGIGAQVEGAGDYLRIVSPFPGSPAEKAGLQPRDLIVKVDGKDVAGMGEAKIISLVRGPAGSKVHLTIQREGSANLLEFDVIRAKITLPSVESKMLDGNVAYVKLNDFGAKTPDELNTALKTLLAQKPVGLVLDLRNNPGGYVDTAISVASQFIPSGVIMRARYNDGSEQTHQANTGGLATNLPLVVLVNKGSASASEIVAGSIQDYARGKIVGETSYGKGSEQQLTPLKGNNGVVRVTIAHWFTPKGRSIEKVGITPDVPVTLTADDTAANRDPQLDAAVKILLNK
jgi:carboxyl-terminal processing protease